MDIIGKPSSQFLLGFIVSIAYIPGIVGASVPTGWFVLIILAPLLVIPTAVPLFLLFASLSLLWTANLNIALFFLLQLTALWLVFEFGRTLKTIIPIFKGIALGLGVSSLLALAQYKGFRQVFTLSDSTAGLFLNPNIYSEVSAVVLVGLLYLKLYWYIPFTLPGLILVHSRTAILALSIGLLILAPNKYRLPIVIASAVVAFILFHNYFLISSIQERLNLWADTLRGLSLFGNGIGSFEILYPKSATNIDTSLFRPRYAHNDLLQLIFDCGIGVLLLIPILWKVIKSVNPILYSLAIVSLLTFPFHVPLLAFVGCLVAGFVTSSDDPVWNFRNIRRPVLFKRN